MKKVTSFLFALVISAAAFAGNEAPANKPAEVKNLQVGMYVAKNNKVKLIVDKVSADTKAYVVMSHGGEVLDRQVVDLKRGSMHISYDVSGLADGTYTFDITAGKERVTKSITLDTKPAEKQVLIQ